ncbi:MAG: molecular chaperone DnaJ [Hyphomicrobiales bacterium]|nr:MAG: molecular chaperone DnaJ [Hyphomicrobiales bacterium]
MPKRCYYETLSVSRSASEAEIKSAFRTLAKEHHPDRNQGDKDAEQKFKEIAEAYEALKDPQKRAAYDQYGHAAFENGGNGQGFAQDFGSSMSDIFEDLFGDFMGGGRRGGQPHAERGSDLRYNLQISLEDAFQGKSATIEVPSSVGCQSCNGTGAREGTAPTACPTCHGRGKVRATQGFFTIERPCPTCHGSGQIISEPCEDCHGHGRVVSERTLNVNIPPGVEDGTRIRLAGEGEAGLRGGPPGDLYIFLSIEPHEFFQRDGADLFCSVPLSLVTATLGGSFEAPTIDGGRTRVKVPEGTQSGKQFRLRGKGMPVLRSKQVGDLFIQVGVEIPVHLSRKQKALLKEFEELSSDKNSPQSSGFFARVKDFFDSIGE